MDPRVGSGRVGSGWAGSGHDFAGFGRVGSGRVSTLDFVVFFTDYFLVPKSIWIFEYYTFGLIDFYDIQYRIINQFTINYSIEAYTYMGEGSGRGSDRVRIFVRNRGLGRVGSGDSGQGFAESIRVQEKWPVDNSDIMRRWELVYEGHNMPNRS